VDRRRLFAAACAGLFFFGTIVALLGTLFGLPGMRERLGIDLAQQGNLFSMLFVGMLIATAVAGPAIDRFGHQATLTSASLLAAMGLTGLSLSGSFWAAALSIAVVGLGGGGLNTGTNAVVSELYPEDRGRMLNLLGMFFGAGALFVPLVKVLVFGALSIGGLIGVMVALGTTCTFVYGVARFPPARVASGVPLSELVRAATYPGVVLFALLLLVQTGNESTLSGWITTYIGYMGWPARVATGVLAGYWAAAIAGRALFAQLSQSVERRWIVVGCGVGMMGGCGWLMASQSIAWLTVAALMTSVAVSGVFQTTLAMVGDRYHQYTGTVFGFVLAVSGLGGMITPAILGHVSQARGLRTGMAVPLVGAAIVTALAASTRRKA
jgi:MFS family permease